MCLAYGQQSSSLVQNATVPITVGGRTFQIDLIFLPHAKDDSPVEINSSSCPTNSIPSEIPLHSNTVDEAETNDLHLREEEGQALNVEERNDLMVLLNESKDVFRLGGEPTPFVKHFINTECESPYAAPVVLVPKSNGTFRLCIDYSKLNAITIPDKCPLPLMDVLLHGAKSTVFMSTLDLKSGYHQKLSKKSTAWKWSEIEQQAFKTLKQCLITPPILRQVDPKKPFLIRTDASSYALGAVLLQGESPTDEQPVDS
ncbi:transposon Ty3-I Gag-Pol polyprotein [Trichonephila clavipes]|nr:transposon Ty3-I Gag-Pol polyprotein [Trichonephila clavipes]